MNERIKHLRKYFHLTQAEFADQLGLSLAYISQLESGKTVPTDKVIHDICKQFCVKEEWIRSGTGAFYADTIVTRLITVIRIFCHSDPALFAARVGASVDYVENLVVHPEEKPPESFMDRVCEEFQVDPAWLYCGYGNIISYHPHSAEIAEWVAHILTDSSHDSDIQYHLLDMLRQLNTEQWKALNDMAKLARQ